MASKCRPPPLDELDSPKRLAAPRPWRARPLDGRSATLLCAVCCGVFLLWLFPGLVGHDPWKPDEAYTFGLVHHILTSGDWVIPTLAGEPFMEKPPIYFLVAALSAKLASPWLPTHDGARLASGLFMLVTASFTTLTARSLMPSSPVWLAPMVLLGNVGLIVPAHQLLTDNALLAGVAVAVYGLTVAPARPVLGGIWLGTGAGLGFMAKGLLLPGVLALSVLALPIAFPVWRTRRLVVTLLVAALAALPWLTIWPLALYLRSPSLFRDWLWLNNFGRFFGFAGLGPPAPPLFYFRLLPWFAFPALLFAAVALWREGRWLWRAPRWAGVLSVTVVAFAALSAASDAQTLYGLPLLVPLSIIAARGVEQSPAAALGVLRWAAVIAFSVLAVAIWLVWAALQFGVPQPLALRLAATQPGFVAHFEPAPLLIATLITAGWLALAARLPAVPRNAIVVWCTGLAVCWGLLGTLLLAYLDYGKSYRGMIREIEQALPSPRGCIASRNLGEHQQALLDYLAGIRTVRPETGGDTRPCDLWLVQGRPGEEPSMDGGWVRSWEGARPGDGKEHFWLFRRLTP
jgi:4-amino-4-deoxy-L-arabinose transferase-like glycosyltransferase